MGGIKMKYFIIEHIYNDHYEDSYTVCTQGFEPTVEEVVKAHNIDFEPEKGEEIIINPVSVLEVKR